MKKKETDFDPDEYKGIYKNLDLNWDEEIKNLRDEGEREIILPTLSAKLMPHHRGEKKCLKCLKCAKVPKVMVRQRRDLLNLKEIGAERRLNFRHF